MDLGRTSNIHTHTHTHSCAHTSYKRKNQVVLKIHARWLRMEAELFFSLPPPTFGIFMAHPES